MFNTLNIAEHRQSVLALWGMSTYFGNQQPLTQVRSYPPLIPRCARHPAPPRSVVLDAQAGHLVGHVRNDEGKTKRVSNCTPVPLAYHADNADIVFLACRSQAASGGTVLLAALVWPPDICMALVMQIINLLSCMSATKAG